MPYIPEKVRDELEPAICALMSKVIRKDGIILWGTLNYVITQVILSIPIRDYETLQNTVGLLECVKQEFYRRAVVPYEEDKIHDNGDIDWSVPR